MPSNQSLASPVGNYQPQLLMLAPESGEDRYTLSLLAQLLELGVAVELDDNWRLPTTPPKDLSAYKECLFPESSRKKYDRDLDAFYRAGGFIPYFRYYPQEGDQAVTGVHYFAESFGRDAYCWHCANTTLEGGLAIHQPDFISTMSRRPLESILIDFKSHFMDRHAGKEDQPWTDWKDPDFIFLTNHMYLADGSGDPEWSRVMHSCLNRIAAGVDTFLAAPNVQVMLADVVEGYVAFFAALMMRAGDRYNNPTWTNAGVKLGRKWFEGNCDQPDKPYRPAFARVCWSEFYQFLPCLYWLARVTGDNAPHTFADAIAKDVGESTQRDDGLWAHYTEFTGRMSAPWSRATGWACMGMSLSIEALAGRGESADYLLARLERTFDALLKHQHPTRGLWSVVMDQHDARLESSGTACAVFAFDRLAEFGLASPRHTAMNELAFNGLTSISYRQGIAACCRGTALGVDEYYRTRPLGYSPGSTFFGSLVGRRAQGALAKTAD